MNQAKQPGRAPLWMGVSGFIMAGVIGWGVAFMQTARLVYEREAARERDQKLRDVVRLDYEHTHQLAVTSRGLDQSRAAEQQCRERLETVQNTMCDCGRALR